MQEINKNYKKLNKTYQGYYNLRKKNNLTLHICLF